MSEVLINGWTALEPKWTLPSPWSSMGVGVYGRMDGVHGSNHSPPVNQDKGQVEILNRVKEREKGKPLSAYDEEMFTLLLYTTVLLNKQSNKH